MSFHLVVAMDINNGIGKNGTLPWRLPADLKHFKEITTKTEDPSKKNAVIMGRKTWESLPESYRPLPNRVNIVLSRKNDLKLPPGVRLEHDLASAVEAAASSQIESVFVIGGGQVFVEALELASCGKIYLTRIVKDFDCDTFFPVIVPSSWKEVKSTPTASENGLPYSFSELVRK